METLLVQDESWSDLGNVHKSSEGEKQNQKRLSSSLQNFWSLLFSVSFQNCCSHWHRNNTTFCTVDTNSHIHFETHWCEMCAIHELLCLRFVVGEMVHKAHIQRKRDWVTLDLIKALPTKRDCRCYHIKKWCNKRNVMLVQRKKNAGLSPCRTVYIYQNAVTFSISLTHAVHTE